MGLIWLRVLALLANAARAYLPHICPTANSLLKSLEIQREWPLSNTIDMNKY
jgi:hypothetical protein